MKLLCFYHSIVQFMPLFGLPPLPGPEGSTPGFSKRLLKGDRGARDGKYLVLIEIESVEARDRFAPAPNQSSEETDQFSEEHKEVLDPLFQKWATFSPTNFSENLNYTDYRVLSD